MEMFRDEPVPPFGGGFTGPEVRGVAEEKDGTGAKEKTEPKIAGMTCATCVVTIEKSHQGVEQALPWPCRR
ncbi:MAG: hypothetical protein LUO97_06165 [Methanomicrobiales archaeon]|nr:hypothetical protein [Methanomicrobiales archaeon]